MIKTIDVITYSGEINLRGYESICEVLAKRTPTSANALLVLSTPGGDPNAGFRIARALQHHYDHFDALVPRFCKSAGTLLVVGARRLYLDDMSELGPLDVQVKKSDEVFGRSSGLDILQAVNYLHTQAMTAFRNYLLELTRDAGLSTKIASDIAANLTKGLYEPVFAQIDPMKLAEMQRATEIAFAYGSRLNEKSNNLRPNGLQTLVTGYPSHGFVIDRKEAKTIFFDVQKPHGIAAQLSTALRATLEKNTNSSNPDVAIYSFNDIENGAADAVAPNTIASSDCHETSDAAVNGSSQDVPSTTTAAEANPAVNGNSAQNSSLT
jgi:hypothetical protein